LERVDVPEGLQKAVFHDEFREDLAWWSSHRPKTARKVVSLTRAILKEPAARELGQPLRHALEGCSTRRLLGEHRLVYRCAPDTVHFLQCRYHP